MGADWLKFKVPEGADMEEIRHWASLLSELACVGWRILEPEPYSRGETGDKSAWEALCELDKLLGFPLEADTSGTGYGLSEPLDVAIEEVVGCRVYVISYNPIFPIEWRDEAYRVILPDELPGFYQKWTTYISEVRAGEWQDYLHELYLFDRVRMGDLQEKLEDLVWVAEESLERTNVWAQREEFIRIRDEIIETNLLARLEAMQAATPIPSYDVSKKEVPVSQDVLDKEREYWALRDCSGGQIKQWNRRVPQRRKVRYPAKITFEEFFEAHQDPWLENFFAWCEYLMAEQCGLLLWN